MRWKVFWAIFGVAAGVIVVVLGIAVASVNGVRERATRSELERVGAVLADVVTDRISDDATLAELIASGTVARFGPELSAIRRAAGSNEVVFFGISPDGRVLGRAQVSDMGLDLEALRSGETQFVKTTQGPREVWVHAQPLGEIGARRIEAVALLTRLAPVDVQIPRGLLVFTLVGVAAAAALTASLLARGISRRIEPVVEAARKLSDGDLAARAEVEGSDEITVVASAFNEMAAGLQQSRERERQFLLAVGHDLRTPLTTIAGYAEALEEGLDEPAEVSRIAEVLGVESARLKRLIEDVMLLARLESAEFTLRPEPVELAAHLRGMLQGYVDRARDLRIDLSLDIAEVGIRMIDPDRFSQIGGNLLDNALRFTPETGRIEVSLTGGDEVIRLRVQDTGPGIEPDDLERIFDRFYVARRYRGVRPEGSGLGLSIVDQLVRVMGGSVTAESTDGTMITVSIPARRIDAPGDRPPGVI